MCILYQYTSNIMCILYQEQCIMCILYQVSSNTIYCVLCNLHPIPMSIRNFLLLFSVSLNCYSLIIVPLVSSSYADPRFSRTRRQRSWF